MNLLSISQIVDLVRQGTDSPGRAGTKLESGDGKVLIDKISTDSRTLQRGELFVALRGENFDGHKFVEAAAKAGAEAYAAPAPMPNCVIRRRNWLAGLCGAYRMMLPTPHVTPFTPAPMTARRRNSVELETPDSNRRQIT